MDVKRAGSVDTRRGNDAWFTGAVLADTIVNAPAPARLSAARVSFAPGARTAWHTHPLGQTLYVLSGVGRVQTRGEPIRVIRPGDVVWIPPGETHWHGAAPTTGMSHIAMHETVDGDYATWMELVTDEEYGGPTSSEV